MKLYLTSDEYYPYYSVVDSPKYLYSPTEVELSAEEWFDYNKVESLHSLWQHKLEDMYKGHCRKVLLDSTKGGVEPKGFN